MGPDIYGEFFGEFFPFGAAGSAIGAVVALITVIMLLTYGYAIMVYIFHALGMYSIAKRRGIHNPWLAWIPVADNWILGSISDQYQYVVGGKVRNRRKVLLGLNIAMFAVAVVMVVLAFVAGFQIGFSGMELYDMDISVLWPLIGLVVAYLALFVIAIILIVFQYIAYYDLFVSCKPNAAVAFLILSIFFNFLPPFFVFACRKHDGGMPPRKVTEQLPSWQPAAPSEEAPVWQQPEE